MKLIPALAVLALTVAGTPAHAQRSRPAGYHGTPFVANKTFGLGLELGDIAGLTGKWFFAPSHALDFGIGDIYSDYYVRYSSGLHLYADYLWHPFVLTKADAFELPFFVGVGGRYYDSDYCPGGPCAQVFGIRVPVGITFDFNNVPLDIFIQLVPTLDFFSNYAPHDFYLDFDFSVGIRYWFS
jgi:hypothetical protein